MGTVWSIKNKLWFCILNIIQQKKQRRQKEKKKKLHECQYRNRLYSHSFWDQENAKLNCQEILLIGKRGKWSSNEYKSVTVLYP